LEAFPEIGPMAQALTTEALDNAIVTYYFVVLYLNDKFQDTNRTL
jgi:hypothetical protein